MQKNYVFVYFKFHVLIIQNVQKRPLGYPVETYEDSSTAAAHGFAFLPGFLYLYAPFYMLHQVTDIPFEFFFKAVILLADMGIGVLLIKSLYKKKKPVSLWYTAFALVAWYFNPHLIRSFDYVFTDPVPIFFMFLALFFVGSAVKHSDIKSGIFYAFAVATKTFPVLLLVIMISKAKNKWKFLLVGAIVALLISIPFLHDPITYLRGALLVHGDRPYQGKPFLFYLSFLLSLEFIRVIPGTFYSTISIVGAWIVSAVTIDFKRLSEIWKNKYVLAVLAFVNFYVFTPVLNRTYLLWFFPFLLVAMNEAVENRSLKPRYAPAGLHGLTRFHLAAVTGIEQVPS